MKHYRLMNKAKVKSIGRFLLKDRSFTFSGVLRFLSNLLISYVVFWVSLYLSARLAVPSSQPVIKGQIGLVSGGSILLVVFTYLRQLLISRRKEVALRDQKLIYDCFGGAIERLIEVKRESESDGKWFVSDILVYFEKVVGLVLKNDGIRSGELCANLMLKRTNPLRLSLVYFGTALGGREKLDIQIDARNRRPGAPEAFDTGKVAYIDNTMGRKYKRFFDENKPYRSILSIPICNLKSVVFSVLNIDSSLPDQFISTDYISKRILPVINPFISIIQLQQAEISRTK